MAAKKKPSVSSSTTQVGKRAPQKPEKKGPKGGGGGGAVIGPKKMEASIIRDVIAPALLLNLLSNAISKVLDSGWAIAAPEIAKILSQLTGVSMLVEEKISPVATKKRSIKNDEWIENFFVFLIAIKKNKKSLTEISEKYGVPVEEIYVVLAERLEESWHTGETLTYDYLKDLVQAHCFRVFLNRELSTDKAKATVKKLRL
ncbi:hypothetical protein RJO15_18715 [Herbaspirillum huttiense F1]|uniref:hypothetical protein n=1 Tax=Herbaspirillum huttiense TaxID=863372 RepID=UPI002887BDD9|nr:hypothetical protein [Herbaspirillum huttiense]MDT0357829.1 hypothetical protein [Herbaspirillum huttiense F1]